MIDTVIGVAAGNAAFSVVSHTGLNILAHETGHLVAASTLLSGSHAHIVLTPPTGGYTSFNGHAALSALGEKLGVNASMGIIAGAGAGVDALIAGALFAKGFKMRHEHPVIGSTMMGYAGFSMLNDVLYAGMAIGGNLAKLAATGNDFASLALATHISPLLAAGALALLLPAEYLLLRAAEKRAQG